MNHQWKVLALALAAISPSAWASGFAVQNQAGSGNGNAFSGAAAAADDASTIFFNPAGMSLLGDGHNISVAGTLLSRSVQFTNSGSTGDHGWAPLVPTSNGGNAGGLSLLPAGYWAYALSKQWSVGVGVSPTFGNKTEYAFNFFGRNAGYFAEMAQININPSLAYKVSDAVSLGFGINLAHNETHFKQGYPLTLGPLAAADNFVDIKGDGTAWGYNLGAMFQLSPATRLGVAYRSELKFELQGKYDVKTPIGTFVDQNIHGVLKTPANASLSLSHRVNDRLELLADATWTDWSVVDNIDLKNGSGTLVARLSYNFKDTMRYGIGANYQYNDQWKLRFGIAYDETPVKTPADRTMTLPDSNRTWLAFGGRYALSKASSIDLSYSHIFFAAAPTSRAVTVTGLGTVQTIRGGFNTSADQLSVQYNQRF